MVIGSLSRERMAWTALVVALATSASWLAAIDLTLLARQAGVVRPEFVVAGRALVRVAWMLIRHAAPAALVALFFSGLILLAWTQRHEARLKEGANHA
jgi:hypothetical protein